MTEIEIEVLENEEMWSQRAIDAPEEVLVELNALKEASVAVEQSHHVKRVEDFKESDK